MNQKSALETAKELLKAAQEKPEQFQDLKKDDMPHLPNSPEDKAHDVIEEDESIKQALAVLDTPEKRKKMLEHLQTIDAESQQRSEENQEAGETPKEEAKEDLMDKSEMVEAAKQLIALAKNEPAKFEEIVKAMAAPAPAPAPVAKKPMPAPKMPSMQMKKPAMAKCGTMSKEEIKTDLKQEWKPRFLKAKGK